MKAGKAYISSLGTTGLLIASSVLLLAVVGAIVAYDRWPDDEPSRADVVAVDGAQRAVPARSVTSERRRAARARAVERRRRAAARSRRARARKAATPAGGRWAESAPLTDPVISDLPAPDSDGSPGQPSGGRGTPGGGGRASGPSGGGTGGRGSETTRHLGDTVSNVSPQAGTAIGDVGTAVDQAVGVTAPSLSP